MSKISISNTDSQVAREVSHAPAESYVTEAIRNCLEAIGNRSDGLIQTISFNPRILGEEFETQNTNKLCIFNNIDEDTNGLNAKELREATDLSSSLNKAHGLTEHFGRGIKVTALNGNPEGFLWGSRCGDKKFLVWLRKNELSEYERYDFYETLADSDTGFTDVLDISDIELPFDNIEGDYNFYVFLGKTNKQNTVSNPWGQQTPQRSGWLINTIYTRFWEWPKNVKLRMEVGHSKGKGSTHYFTSLPNWLNKLQHKGVRTETVKIPNSPLEVTYVHDPEFEGSNEAGDNKGKAMSLMGSPMTATPFSGIIYKGEIHDVTTGNELKAVARSFGIPFGCKYLRAFIHLPISSEYEHDADRQYIRFNDEKRTVITQFEYSFAVRENRPDWFIEEIEKLIPNFGSENLQEELQKLADNLELYAPLGGRESSDNGPGTPGTNNNSSKKPRKPEDTKRRKRAGNRHSTIPAPEIECLYTAKDVDNSSAEQIKNRAAQYDLDQHILTLNYTYDCCSNTIDRFIDEYSHSPVIDKLEVEIRNKVQNLFGKHIGMLAIYGYQKKVNKHWDYEQIIESTSPNALTNSVDSWLGPQLPMLESEINKLNQQLASAAKPESLIDKLRRENRIKGLEEYNYKGKKGKDKPSADDLLDLIKKKQGIEDTDYDPYAEGFFEEV